MKKYQIIFGFSILIEIIMGASLLLSEWGSCGPINPVNVFIFMIHLPSVLIMGFFIAGDAVINNWTFILPMCLIQIFIIGFIIYVVQWFNKTNT